MQGPNEAMHSSKQGSSAKQKRKAIASKQQSKQRRAEKGKKTKAREAALHRQEQSRDRAMRKLKNRKRRKWMGRNSGM